jgi:beta-fructofuranosidase
VLEKGSTVELPSANGAQLDIEVAFAMPEKSEGVEQANERLTEDGALHCSQIITHANYSYGPFGVHVLATDDLRERTSIFFYVTHDGNWKTLFCSNHSSSSLQQDVDKTTYGSYVRVHKIDDVLTLRILVDHSIVESFAQDGRTVITSRVYPEFAINDSARTFLFNNGSQSVTVKSVTTWDMPNVHIKDF